MAISEEDLRATGIGWVCAELEGSYGSADLGNQPEPVAELVYISLTRQTHRQNAMASWQRIVALGGPGALLQMPEEALEELLRPAGFSRQKARWIQQSLREVQEQLGELSLARLESWQDEAVEAFLVTLPGIGIKSARCIMMYSMGRQVLPVDTHLRRLSERLGWVQAGLTERRIHQHLDRLVAPELRYGLHVNAIWHGREVCTPVRPRCPACPLRLHCRTGREAAQQ